MSKTQNIDVRFRASTDFAQAKADLVALNAQVDKLNESLNKGAFGASNKMPPVLDAGRWLNVSKAVENASSEYRNALSSSGLFTTQQIRGTTAAEQFTKSLQAQKLSLGDIVKNYNTYTQAYKEQLKIQRMTAQYWGTDSQGRAITDITLPKNVPNELDSWRRKMGFFGQAVGSAGTQMVNLGKNIQWSGRQLTVGLTYPVALLGAAAGVMAYKVDAAFANINKVYNFSAKAQTNEAQMLKEQNALRVESLNTATQAAKQYGATLDGTLKIEQAFAATGLTGKNLQQTTLQTQRISTLGDINPEQTQQMIISLQTAFKKTIPDSQALTNTLNYMNAAANATSLSLQDIAEATPRAAAGFANLGGNAKEMTVLLVSMREAGIQAAQAANAIKSASARILNPPTRALTFYQQYGIDLENIAKQSGGDLLKYLELFGKAQQKIEGPTKKQTDLIRAQGLGLLFGTYQANRLTAAITNLGRAQSGVNNQTAAALALMKETPQQLAVIAAASQKAMMDNPAGRFRQEWAQFQIELQSMGQPFIRFAGVVLKTINGIVDRFNHLNSTMKNWLAGGIGIAALAGPVIMLGGLITNLTGQVVKFVGFMLRLGGISKLQTAEQKANELATKAQNDQLKAMEANTEALASSTATFADEVKTLESALTSALAEINRQLTATNATMSGLVAEEEKVTNQIIEDEQAKADAIAATTDAYQTQMEEMVAAASAAAQKGQYQQVTAPVVAPIQPETAPPMLATGFRGESIMIQDRATQAANDAAAAQATQQLQQELELRAQMANKQNANLAIEKKMTGQITASRVGAGLMAASIAAMVLPLGHGAAQIGQWALGLGLMLPILSSVNKGIMRAVTSAKEMIAAERLAAISAGEAAAAQDASTASAVAQVGVFGALKSGAVGFGAALTEALGPIGLIALAGAGIFALYKTVSDHQAAIAAKQKALVEQQVKANNAMENSTASIATNLGKAAGAYRSIVSSSPALGGGTNASSASTLQQRYNFYANGGGKQETQGLLDVSTGSIDNTMQLMDKARQKFIDLQVEGSDTAKQAQTDLTAMLMAAGTTYNEASAIAKKIYDDYGSVAKIDWSKPLRDQAKAMADIQTNTPVITKTSTDVLNGNGGLSMSTLFGINQNNRMYLQQQAKKAAQIFQEALTSSASDPKEQAAYMKQFFAMAYTGWNEGFKTLATTKGPGFTELQAAFAKYGVDSGKSFATAWETNVDFKKTIQSLVANEGLTNPEFAKIFQSVIQSGSAYERSVVQPLAKANGILADSTWQVVAAMKQLNQAGYGVGHKQAAQLIEQSTGYMKMIALQKELLMMQNRGQTNSPGYYGVLTQLNSQSKSVTANINRLNDALGLKEGRTAAQALYNLMNNIAASTDQAKNKANDLNTAIKQIPTRMSIQISASEVPGIVQSAMQGVEQDMAASADAKLQAQQQAAQNALQSRQQAAQTALQNKQQAQQNALQKKFQEQENAVTKSYNRRIDAINKEVAREQSADQIRQNLFNNEKNRIQQLADMQNTNIDFNLQVQQGNLAAAAIDMNNAAAKSAQNEMDNELARQQQADQARIAGLQKRAQELTKQRDSEVKTLQNLEQREQTHLQKIQAMRTQALQQQQAAETAALQASQDAEKQNLDAKLALFQDYVATNQRDLQSWMRQVKLTYDKFGVDITNKGKSWANSFQVALEQHIKAAGMQVVSNDMWKGIGQSMAGQLLQGIGFSSIKSFSNFVKTGNLPKNFGEVHHGGGIVGQGSTGRAGKTGGLHADERFVLAQDGERIMSKEATKKYDFLLRQIEKGTWNKLDRHARGGMSFKDNSGGVPIMPVASHSFAPVTGVVSGGIANLFSAGLGQALASYVKSKEHSQVHAAHAGRHSGLVSAVYVPGSGGKHRPIGRQWPITQGLHDQWTGYPAIDFGAPIGSPVYAIGDGVITASYDIRGYEPQRRMYGVTGPSVQDGYMSYGRVMYLHTDNGDNALYAHLSKRGLPKGARVKGGSQIGLSGNTGNVQSSTGNGAHLHFGSTPYSPYAFLRQGGMLRWDNTLVMGHKGETMLSAPLTKKFQENVANGGGNHYDITIDLTGAVVKDDIDFKAQVKQALAEIEGAKGRSKVVRSRN